MKTMWKAVALTGAFVSAQAYALNVPGPLVDPQWVNQHKGEVVILEIGKKKKTAHLPGAVPVDYKKVRVKGMAEGVKAKGLVPSKEAWHKMVRSWGVNNGDAIVLAYAGKGFGDATQATRIYWQFKYYGYDNVTIMNGGVKAWKKAKLPLDKKGHGASGKQGNFTAGDARADIYASTAEVEAASQGKNGYQLLDSRDMGLYLGTWHKGSVKKAGHIPGALFYGVTLNTSAKPAKFFGAATYNSAAKAINVDLSKPSIVYCNTGHLATGNWFILHEILGNKKVKLYDGSMHLWTLHGKPVERFTWNNGK